MTPKRNYKDLLDAAYAFAPFRLINIIDINDPPHPSILFQCQVCGNKSLRFLRQVTDKMGTTWLIGSECWLELDNRQFRDKLPLQGVIT